MSDVKLNLLVLKTHQLVTLGAFSSALGVSFVEERHGEGPLHLAARVGDLVPICTLPADAGPADAADRMGMGVMGLFGDREGQVSWPSAFPAGRP